MNKDKKVAILVPRGFQNKELLLPNQGISHDSTDTPSDGECMKCKGTGAYPHKVWLEDYIVSDHRITTAVVKMAWFKCKCYMSGFWLKFHPLNVQAKLIPKWWAELRDMKEKAKEEIIRASGGSYNSHSDTFLADLAYKPPAHSPLVKTLADMNFSGIVNGEK